METIIIAGRVLSADDAALVLDAVMKAAAFNKKQSIDTNSNLTTGSKITCANKAKNLSRIVDSIKGSSSSKSKQRFNNHHLEL